MLSRMKMKAFDMMLTAVICCIGITVCTGNSVTFADQTGNARGGEEGMPEKNIEEVLKEHTPELMSRPGVVGTGQSLCDGQPCIKVFVVKETPELKEEIPDTLEGYPVVIKESGKFRALPRK
ncbi:MAG: hypothetical protein JSU72_16665 [Deltaproteobacteria bacterium]|nr:MAG: hypothetical protein JSU72_16665 [Deltaproteobacteria bacterium]